MMRRLRLAAIAALGLSTMASLAQTSTGTVAGRVADPQGRPVAGATVTVTNTDLSTARTARTDAQGNFRAAALLSGAYTVAAKSRDLATRRPVRLTLTAGSIVHVDVPMSLPQVKQSATVRARAGNVEGNTVAPEVNKEDASVGIFLPGMTVTYLPNRDRDYTQDIELTPGAVEDASGNGVIIAGQRSSALAVQVDGVSFNDPLLGGERGAEDRGFFLPQTVVREFQVLHAGVSAEVGGTNTGLVNIVTKAGSGKLHGEFFYTGRPSQLTSNDAFGHSLANTQNTFGGSSGGPFGGHLKNKAFYYAGFEQDILHVPTWSEFTPQGTTVLLPAAVGNQQGQIVQSSTPSAFFGRIDLVPYSKDTLAIELGFNHIHATNFPDALNTGASTRTLATQANEATAYGHSQTAIVQWTHLLRPSVVNEATVAWSGDHRGLNPNSTAPELYINGFGILGGNSFGTQVGTSQQTQLKDDITLARGSSVLSFGGFFGYDPAYQQQEANLDGRFDYNSLTDFLNNNPRRYQQTFATGNIRYQGSVKELALYANGRFTLRKTLTVTAGLRWAGQFNPQPHNAVTAVPVGIVPGQNVVEPLTNSIPNDLKMWQPRVGVAWNPRPKTVVRLSAGLFDANTPADVFHRVFVDGGGRVTTADSYFDPSILALALANGTGHPLSTVPVLTTPGALETGIAPGFRNPASGQFGGSVERQAPAHLDITLGYLHNSTWDLQRRLDTNLNPPTSVNAGGEPVFGARPNTSLGRVLMNESNAHSSYDGFLFTAVAQISRRTTVTANYTVSKTRDDDDTEGPFSLESALDPFDLKAEAGPSAQDVRLNFNLAAIFNLPAGLKLNPVFIGRTGMPYTGLIGFDTQHDANDWNDRQGANYGAGRNSASQPGFSDLDLRVVKDFTLKGEGHHLDLFMDVFNVVGSSNRGFGPGSFTLTGGYYPVPSFYSAGLPLFAPDTTRLGGAREFQFTARLVGF